jgi:hypothetical protein
VDERIKPQLFKVMDILEEYLSEVVFAGGWAPLIYYHYLVGDKTRTPLLTQEFDLMVRRHMGRIGKGLHQLLLEAGLRPEPRDSSPRPAQIFSGEIEGDHLEIEFFTPMTGRGRDDAVEVQTNLLALPLRFADIVISNAIEVAIDDHPLYTNANPIGLLVPSPGAFVFNKGLTFSRRQVSAKKEKDLYYIFDILARCPELREEILEDLSILKHSSATHGKWFNSFLGNMSKHFRDPDGSGVNMLIRQRPSMAFSNLDDQQFRQYAFEALRVFLGELNMV